MSNADRCVRCGATRLSHAMYTSEANPPGWDRDPHAFVEPAPQPESAVVQTSPAAAAWVAGMQSAPSGDEAKVREIADKTWARCVAYGSDASMILTAVREAYAAGARAEQKECELTVRDSCICQGAECVCSAWLRDIARAIARRGSEGK